MTEKVYKAVRPVLQHLVDREIVKICEVMSFTSKKQEYEHFSTMLCVAGAFYDASNSEDGESRAIYRCSIILPLIYRHAC